MGSEEINDGLVLGAFENIVREVAVAAGAALGRVFAALYIHTTYKHCTHASIHTVASSGAMHVDRN